MTLLDRDHRDQLTAATRLTADVENACVHLASHSRLPKINRVLLAPFYRQRKLLVKGEHHRQTHDTQAALMAPYAGHDERRGI